MILRSVIMLLCTMTLLVGCGKPTKKVVTVTGTVTYNGQQLKAGILKFEAPNGDFATAMIAPDGKFTMTDVVPGTQKVAFMVGPMGSGSSDGSKTVQVKQVEVPPKFGDFGTSGVTVNVTDDGAPVTIELK